MPSRLLPFEPDRARRRVLLAYAERQLWGELTDDERQRRLLAAAVFRPSPGPSLEEQYPPAVRRAGAPEIDILWDSGSADEMLALAVEIHRGDLLPERIRAGLREFACSCADDAGAHGEDDDLVSTARGIASGCLDLDDAHAVRDRIRPQMIEAARALPQCMPWAAASMAAWHTCADHPLEAAQLALHFAGRAAAFRMAHRAAVHWCWDKGSPGREGWKAAAWAARHPEAMRRAEEDAYARHAAILRSRVPSLA